MEVEPKYYTQQAHFQNRKKRLDFWKPRSNFFSNPTLVIHGIAYGFDTADYIIMWKKLDRKSTDFSFPVDTLGLFAVGQKYFYFSW